MNELFELDANKCVRCGLCVEDCAFGALKRDENALPRLANPSECMRCQHCLAICPKGAVTFDAKRPEDSISTRGIALPTLEEIENWLHTRRSIRKFAKEDVDRETLSRILRTLANTPTGCNARALSFTCLPSRASLEKFKTTFISALEHHRDGFKMLPRWLAIPAIQLRKGKRDIFFRNAAGMLVISSDVTSKGVTTPVQDVTIACSNFELLANAAGIATCWCGFLNLAQSAVPELLETTLGIDRRRPFYAILFGKGAVRYARGVQRDDYAQVSMLD